MYRECSECGRQIPFDETEECDLCGKQGAFTFSTGDCMCNDCAFGEPPTSGKSGSATGYVPQPLDNDLVDKIIARNLPLAITGSYPASCISFAREIEAEVHEKVKQQLGT